MSILTSTKGSSQSYVMSSVALVGMSIFLISIIVLSIVGTTLIPCGIIFFGTPLFQGMIVCSALGAISALFFIGSCIKLYQENQKTLNN